MRRTAARGRAVIKARILTGAILLPLLVAFVWKSDPFQFCVLTAVAAGIGLDEFYRMALPDARRAEGWLAALLGATLVPILALGRDGLVVPALTAATLLFALLYLFRYRELASVVQHCSLTAFGWLYVPLLLGHVAMLRTLAQGREAILAVFLIVMAGDTCAYFVGSAVGKRRLYPAISPKKSVEGGLGGLAGSVAGAVLAKVLWFGPLPWWGAILIGLVLGLLGQLGDLFESMLKRGCGVKDSGAIIPGHGGMLDRLDSLIFAFPAAYYLAWWLG